MAEWVQKKKVFFTDQNSVEEIPESRQWKNHSSSVRPVPVIQVPTSNGECLTSERLRRRALHAKGCSSYDTPHNVTVTRYHQDSEHTTANGAECFTSRAVQTDTLSAAAAAHKSQLGKFTAFECVRLDERERYRQLLQHYTSIHIPQTSKHKTEISASNDRPKLNVLQNKSTISNGSDCSLIRNSFLNDNKNEINVSRSKLREPQRVIISKHFQHRIKSPVEIKKTSDLSYHSVSTQPARPTEDQDKRLKTDGKCLSPIQSLTLDFQTSAYLEDEWVDKLKSRFSSESREAIRKIEEAEITAEVLEEKRNAKEYDLERKIRHRMKILEKQPPILPEPERVEIEDEEEFPELSPEMEEEIDNALYPDPANEILSDGFRLQISRKDMVTLNGLNWLNDEIINFYMNLLMSRSEGKGKPKVYAFNTFFYPKVMSGGHASVKRWTRKIDIFSYDYIVIPIHLGMHWCLAVIDFKRKKIQYYDSMGGANMSCLNALKKYLCDESLDKRKQSFDTNGWRLEMVKDIPQQLNGSDCGMFACKFAEYITREAQINFTQQHMPYFRRRMVYEILKKKLLQ